MNTPDHSAHLIALNGALRPLEKFWRSSPFIEETPLWCAEQPELASECLALDESERLRLDRDPQALQSWLESRLPALASLVDLTALPETIQPADLGSARSLNGIPGRKLEQIASFAGQVPAGHHPVLDWCSGKAHLGRNVARLQGRELFAVERNQALCEAGLALAKDAGVSANFQCANVLTDVIKAPQSAQILALHACGDLHRTLLAGPLLDQASDLVLAPCCYHLWLKGEYQPLSQVAHLHNLRLDRNCVQLAVLETVHAPARELKAQTQLAAWRLGFDALQRDVRGDDSYISTPSLPHRVLAEGFPAVCQRIAEHKGLELPGGLDWELYEQKGFARLHRARRLQLVRHAFRRPIEIWLALDLVLKLEERGFTAQLSTFCDRTVSPRNLLIRAER